MCNRQPMASTKEVAEHLGVSPQTIWNLRRTGNAPPATLVGNRLRWRWTDVETWLAERATISSNPGDTR